MQLGNNGATVEEWELEKSELELLRRGAGTIKKVIADMKAKGF